MGPPGCRLHERTHYGLAFKDGILTEYVSSRPSELLQVAGTPMRIVHGLFDGVSQVISLRTGRNTALAGLTNSELAKLQADAALRAGTIDGERTVSEAELAYLRQQQAMLLAPAQFQSAADAAQLAALNQAYALQGGPLIGQAGLNNLQLGLLQSQTGLGLGQNNAVTQLLQSNMALSIARLRDQELSRCIAAQVALRQPIDSCL
jgi:hypothetical protein